MPITAASLVERVRDILSGYGDISTILVSDATSNATTLSLSSVDGFKPRNWAEVEWECVEITESNTSTDVITVRRGQRGSTAAAHSANTVIRYNPPFTGVRILNALNTAQDAAYPQIYKLVSDTVSVVVDADYTYAVPSGMSDVVRLEIENSDDTAQFYIIRTWDMYDSSTVRIYGDYPVGKQIRFVGTGRFTAMTTTGNLDSAFPTSDTALSYLVYKASAYLLKERQALLGVRDSFVGMTDTFSQTQPFASGLSSREIDALAEDMLKQARMPYPEYYTPLPTRRYLAKN